MLSKMIHGLEFGSTEHFKEFKYYLSSDFVSFELNRQNGSKTNYNTGKSLRTKPESSMIRFPPCAILVPVGVNIGSVLVVSFFFQIYVVFIL